MAEQNWAIAGNAGTNPKDDFLGTTDIQPLSIRTNGIEAMRIKPGVVLPNPANGPLLIGGNVGIGTDDPKARLHVKGGEIRLEQAQRILVLRADGAAVDVQSTTSSLFLHSSGPQGNNHVVINPGPGEGNVGIGLTNPKTLLHVNGTATVGILQITGGSDLAEPFSVEKDQEVDPGTVMVIDEQHPGRLKVAYTPYDRKVAGIVSGAGGLSPGLTLQNGHYTVPRPQVALAGRVYCKAEALLNPIEPGDFLTTSNVPGHAMKAVDERAFHGAILGKAMTPLKNGKGLVLVLVNLL